MEDPYKRATRECTFDQLDANLRAALVKHAAAQGIDDLASRVTHCCETESTQRERPGFFARMLGADPDATHLSAALLGAGRLWVARSAEKAGSFAMSAPLADASFDEPRAGMPAPPGVSVTAPWSSSPERGSFHLGLDEGPAGAAFLAALRGALASVKK